MNRPDTKSRAPNIKRELITIFFVQFRVIVAATLVIFIASVLIAFFWPPLFDVSASVLMRAKKQEKQPENLGSVQERFYQVTTEDLTSEMEILMSDDLLRKVLEKLKAQHPNDAWCQELTLSVLREKLTTSIVPASNVIRLDYRTIYPEEAVLLLDTLLDEYLSYRGEVYTPSGAEKFFDKQAQRYRDGLQTLDNEMVSITEQTSVTMPEKEMENNIALRKDLGQQLIGLEKDKIEEQAKSDHLVKALEDRDFQFFSFLENESIAKLGERLMELFVEKTAVSSKYSPESEKVSLINGQIAEAYGALEKEVRKYQENLSNEVAILGMKIERTKERLEEIDQKNVELQKQLLAMQRIERESGVLEQSYEVLSKKKEEARLNEATRSSGMDSYVTILSRPNVPENAVFPVKRRVLPIGLFVGFLTGCSLGFLREYFDHTIKRTEDVENTLGLPVIFSLPIVKKDE